jgi:hypothetical protein
MPPLLPMLDIAAWKRDAIFKPWDTIETCRFQILFSSLSAIEFIEGRHAMRHDIFRHDNSYIFFDRHDIIDIISRFRRMSSSLFLVSPRWETPPLPLRDMTLRRVFLFTLRQKTYCIWHIVRGYAARRHSVFTKAINTPPLATILRHTPTILPPLLITATDWLRYAAFPLYAVRLPFIVANSLLRFLRL